MANSEENINKIKINKIYKAVVTNIANFGAFVKFLDYNVEGLIHISKISEEFVNDIREYIQVKDEVDVTVIDIKDNKLYLKLVQK